MEESPPRCVGGGALPAQTPMKVKPGRNKEKFKFIAAKPCFSFGLRGRKGFYASVETGIDSVFPSQGLLMLRGDSQAMTHILKSSRAYYWWFTFL